MSPTTHKQFTHCPTCDALLQKDPYGELQCPSCARYPNWPPRPPGSPGPLYKTQNTQGPAPKRQPLTDSIHPRLE